MLQCPPRRVRPQFKVLLLEGTMTITPRATTATSSQAQFFDYGSAANPLQKGLISTIPYRSFSASFFDAPGTALQPLDLSTDLRCEGPATGPSLCGNFIRLDHGSHPVSCSLWPEAMGEPKLVVRSFTGVKAIRLSFLLAEKPFTAVTPAPASIGCMMPPYCGIWV